MAPTLLDQYQHQREYTKVLKSGEKVLVDPETTISHILLIFYAFVNVGAFFSIAVVYIEKYRGFWLAFLAPGIVYFVLPLLLAASKYTLSSPRLVFSQASFAISSSSCLGISGLVVASLYWRSSVVRVIVDLDEP